jgi:hypothetical protein
MQNRRLSWRGGARCGRGKAGVATAVLASLGFVLAGALSGCSIDFMKPESMEFWKNIASTATEQPSAPTVPTQQEGAVNPTRTPKILVAEQVTPPPVDPNSPAGRPPEPDNTESVDEEAEDNAPSLDRVVASVDGDPITERQVKDFASQHGQPIDTDDFAASDSAKTAVKALIGEKLLEQEVKKYDDKVDDDQVDKYIDQLRESKHMSDTEFREQLQASGMSYDELRKRVRLDLEKAMMIEQEVRAKIVIPDADIKAFYDAHKDDFTVTKERLKLAQILVALPANPTPAQVSAAQKKAAMIRARALKGDDFGDLARVYSDDDSKSNGGELGWFARATSTIRSWPR